DALNGKERAGGEERGDIVEEEAFTEEAEQGRTLPGTSILRRLLEGALGGMRLEEIGTTITTPGELQQRLQQFVGAGGGVQLVQHATQVRFDLVVERDLDGDTDLHAAALAGFVTLDGEAAVTAKVRLHLIFGVDSQGFFIDAGNNPEAEFTVSNIHGTAEGQGRLGPLEVALHDGTFSMAPHVSLALNLIEPTPNALQGQLRFADLDALDLSIAHVDVFGGTANDSQHDVTLSGNFVVSAFTFPIAEFALDVNIDSIKGDPNATSNVSISARASGDGQVNS